MNLSEFRIGNWINTPLSTTSAAEAPRVRRQIVSISNDRIGVRGTMPSERYLEFSPKDCSPSLINEAFLLFFHFSIKQETFRTGQKIYVSPNFGIHHEYYIEMTLKTEAGQSCLWLLWDEGGPSNFLLLPTHNNIQHIHQLQNLFFSLSGTELQPHD